MNVLCAFCGALFCLFAFNAYEAKFDVSRNSLQSNFKQTILSFEQSSVYPFNPTTSMSRNSGELRKRNSKEKEKKGLLNEDDRESRQEYAYDTVYNDDADGANERRRELVSAGDEGFFNWLRSVKAVIISQIEQNLGFWITCSCITISLLLLMVLAQYNSASGSNLC